MCKIPPRRILYTQLQSILFLMEPEIEEIDQKTIKFIIQLSVFFQTLLIAFSIPGIVLLIPHLFITTRKSMRTSSTNSLIIGIGICDLLVLITSCAPTSWTTRDPCSNQLTYFYVIKSFLVKIVADSCTRSSYYIGLSLAVIRLLVIRFPMSARTETLSKPSIGYLVIVLMMFVNFLPTANYFLRFDIVRGEDWSPLDTCPNFPSNYSEETYSSNQPSDFQYHLYQVISGCLQCFVSLAHPIVACLLYLVIRKFEKRSDQLSPQANTEKMRASRLVLLMTISYVVSSVPMGLNYYFSIIYWSSLILNLVFSYGGIIVFIIFTINASMHCFICLIMSSEYQKTVRRLLRIREKAQVIVVQSVTL